MINRLKEFIKIESVSTDGSRFDEILAAVEFLKRWLEDLGFAVNIISSSKKTPPLITAYYQSDGDHSQSGTKKTIGIYGHYDVQPEDPVLNWDSPPFTLTFKNGKYYGRGVADNKGPIVQNLTAIEQLIKERGLQNDVVFILEGEEEVGSRNFEELINKVKNTVSQADVFYITDLGMHRREQPQIFYALRGIVYFELEVETGERDLHSGIYGNRVLNPIQVLSDLLAEIKNIETGRILIPNFYQEVRRPSKEELNILSRVFKTDEEEKKETGVFALTAIDKKHPYLSAKIYPSFDVNGIMGGYVGEGIKTIIPAKAKAKFSFSLLEQKNPKKIEKLVFDFVKKNIPSSVKYRLRCLTRAAPLYTDIKNQYVKKTAGVFNKIFNYKTLFNRSGGSVPAAEVLGRVFKKPLILTGFTLPDANVHAPNENIDEEMFWKGIEALISCHRGETGRGD